MKKSIHTETFSEQGFTLIEVIVAIAVLTIGILSLYAMHIASINGNASASNMATGSNWARDRIEILLSRPYDHPDLADTNGDGTGQDADNDGVDDSGGNSINYLGGIVIGGVVVDNAGGNFGLNDGLIFDNTAGLLLGVNKAAADGRAMSPDNRYTILWNVAVDTPAPDCKTIRVIVTSQDRELTKAVTLTYIKSKQI